MKRFSVPRTAVGVTVLVALVGAVFAVASAQAAPIKKKYDAYVFAANTSSTSFTLTLVNDASSQQTLGSANFSAPGLGVAPVLSTPVTTSLGHSWTVCTGSGGVMCGDGANNIVEFRANSAADALMPGESVSFTVSADPTGCTSALWSTAAKQSNDFSGTNNLFNLAANDLTPLGSFVFDPVQTGPPTIAFNVPQIKVNTAAPIRVTALDTCGNVDQDYPNYRDGSTPTLSPTNGLANATFSALSWSHGVGSATLTPVDVEVGDQFSINDPDTGISATSISTDNSPTFDVVQTICAGGGSVCNWKDPNPNKPITAVSTVPGDNGGHASLGLGYKLFRSGVSCGVGSPVGDSIVIDPYQYTSNYTVVLTYGKQLVPSGPASSVVTCKTTDDGVTWSRTAIPQCPNTPVYPCAQPQKISGGALQITLYLRPGDPHTGGFTP